jgi:hypothetical protein
MSTPRPEKATEIKNRSISLNPLTFDQAVDKLLATKPPHAKPSAKKPTKKAKKPSK